MLTYILGILFALLAIAGIAKAISVVDSNSMGIGKWTATQMQPLGTKYEAPAINGGGNRTYMYVQYVKGSGPDVYDGTPVGWTTAVAGGTFIVSGDESAVMGSRHCRGVIRSTGGSTAVTTAYYGWIQLAVPDEILDSTVMKTGAAAGDQVDWTADSLLGTAAAFDSTKSAYPWGVVLTPANKGAAAATTANQISDVLIL